MTWRSGSTPLVAGRWLSSAQPGRGVKAKLIPSSGTHGPAFPFADIADRGFGPDDEIRLRLVSPPAAGRLVLKSDTSGSFTDAPPGTHSFTYQGIRNGVGYGDFVVTLVIGDQLPPPVIVDATFSIIAAAALSFQSSKVGVATISAGVDTQLTLQHSKVGIRTLSATAAAAISIYGASTASAQQADQVASIRASNSTFRYVTTLTGGSMAELIQFFQASSAAIRIDYTNDDQPLNGITVGRYQLFDRDNQAVLTLDLGNGIEFVNGEIVVFVSENQAMQLSGLYRHECAVRDLTGRQHFVLSGPIRFLATTVRV